MPRRPTVVRAGLLFALVTTMSACSGGGSGSVESGLGAKSVSMPAPALAGDTVQGGKAVLSDLRGSVVVVNFWATWCAPCRNEQPDLVQLANDYHDRGVRFLGVSERDDTAKARAWVKEFHVPYPSIVDEPGAWADDFAFFGLPDTYVIDRSGTIRWTVFGQTDATQLKQLIDRVLALPS
ncbi:MAG: TlpA family protein disulfide reductase [Actinomycetota bacterium]